MIEELEHKNQRPDGYWAGYRWARIGGVWMFRHESNQVWAVSEATDEWIRKNLIPVDRLSVSVLASARLCPPRVPRATVYKCSKVTPVNRCKQGS